MDKSKDNIKIQGTFRVWCYDESGNLKWYDKASNLVVDAGLNHILDVVFTGAGESQIDPWVVGLTDSTPTVAAGDTMGSHAGWTEVQAYDEASRQNYVDSRTNQTVDNSASKASFSINADTTTIGGAFLSSDNTKGGTTGILLCAAAFDGGDKSADSGDTLNVQYDFSAADDGV